MTCIFSQVVTASALEADGVAQHRFKSGKMH